MMQIKDTHAVMLAQQLSGTEVFIGAKREDKFGHMVLCGLGGIFIEVLKDVKAGLAPIAQPEALDMIRSLKSYKIIQGVRGQEPVNEQKFAEAVSRVSMLVKVAPEIFEMDLNPLLGNKENVVAVDAVSGLKNEKTRLYFYTGGSGFAATLFYLPACLRMVSCF